MLQKLREIDEAKIAAESRVYGMARKYSEVWMGREASVYYP